MTNRALRACDWEAVRGIWISSSIIERTTKQLKKAEDMSHIKVIVCTTLGRDTGNPKLEV